MPTFLGIDLGWFGKPTGLAAMRESRGRLRLVSVTRVAGTEAILEWVRATAGDGDAMAAVDAPLVITNAAGIRDCERALNAEFRRYHAGCHPANLGRPFAANCIGFSAGLEGLGFAHGAEMAARAKGRYQFEVHPHAAAVRLFGLDRIVKYKRGRRADRAAELARYRGLLATLPADLAGMPDVPERGDLKAAEDQIDAVLCAYVAAHYWRWGRARTAVYGSNADGYVVVPSRPG